MRDNIIGFGIVLIMLMLFIVYPFAIWGGNPEGLWWKVERYKAETDAKIDEISQQIEIIRNQLAQIKPDEKRHNR